MFLRFLDVFVILMTKKCTKNNIFATSSVKNQGGPPTLSPKIQGDPTPFSPLKSLSIPCPLPLNRPMIQMTEAARIQMAETNVQKKGTQQTADKRQAAVPDLITEETDDTPKCSMKLGVLFYSSCATAAQAATVEHESDRP
jgi:hypothetical protein